MFTDKSSYDKGEKVTIKLYIGGGGNIEESKLIGHIPKNIVSGSVTIKTFKFAKSLKGEWEGWKPAFPQQINDFPERFVAQLTLHYFSPVEEGGQLWSEGQIRDPHTGEEYPPVSIEFTISDNAPTTDHRLEFIFSYRVGQSWYISTGATTIHIRSLVEKYSLLISIACGTAISIILVILAYVLKSQA